MKKLCLLAMLLVSVASFAWKPRFAGHRGGQTGVMNTAEAYRNGCSVYHYQGLECDVRVTSDGHYVISHDETTNALGGNLTVANATLAQLQAETYQQTRGGVAYTGHICTVDTFLKICADSARFPIIELKFTTGINSNDMTNFPGLYALITKYHLENNAIILTSMLNSLIYVRQHYPNLQCQYLMNTLSDERFNACVQYGLTPSIQAGGVTGCVVKRCHDAGLEVAAWTVNTLANYQLYGGLGVSMMTCDNLYPDQMPDLAAVDWDDICEETVAPFERLYVSELYNYTEAAGTKPAAFPSASQQAQQAAFVNGVWYGNDYLNGAIYAFDTLGARVNTPLQATPRHGICRDDAGHLILHASPTAGTPNTLLLYRTPSSAADTISFSLIHNGQTNFPTASGDVYSQAGGYVYFFPNGQSYVDILHIVNGQLTEVLTTAALGLTGSTAGYVIPIDNDPTHFVYQVRANGYNMYNSADKGAFVATTSTTTAPGRNSSVGGAYFRLGTHNMFLHGSGSNYNGGWSVKDISGGKADLYTHAPLGTCGYSGNPSCGSFFYVETVDSVTVNVHEWCLGNGYAAWQITSKKPLVITPVSGVVLSEHQLSVPNGGKATLTAEVLPDSAYVKEVTWRSLNDSVATVSQEGVVSAVGQGVAAIVVTTTDGGFADTCYVTVGADLALELTANYTDWNLPYLAGKTVRRMVAKDEVVYVLAVDPATYAPSLYEIDGTNPNQYTELSTSVCTVIGPNGATVLGKYMPLSDIALSEDGVLFGCNQEYTTFTPANAVKIYKWSADSTGALVPEVFASVASTQTAGNYLKACNGHSMAFLGSSTDGHIVTTVYTVGSDTRSMRFSVFNVANGVYKSTIYQRPTTSPTMASMGEDVRLAAVDATHWSFSASGTAPRMYCLAGDAGNPEFTEMPAAQMALGGLSPVEIEGVALTAAPTASGLQFMMTGNGFDNARALTVTGDTLPSSATVALSAFACDGQGEWYGYVLRGGMLSCMHVGEATVTPPTPTDCQTVEADEQVEKFVRNGQLFIRKNGHVYNIQGMLIE